MQVTRQVQHRYRTFDESEHMTQRKHIGISMTNSMAYYNRFVVLLNKHCRLHHDVEHYARELHITSQYLGRICKKYDGRSAKQIICDTLILQLKSALKNTEKTVKEISYEYNFTTFSFMCSFFRRCTGLTPSEFRVSYRNTLQHDGDEDGIT